MTGSVGVGTGIRRDHLEFGVLIEPDVWCLFKRLFDLEALVKIEVRIGGSAPALTRVTGFDLSGVHSAPYSTEEDVLKRLAMRVPTLRVQRYPESECKTLEEIFRNHLLAITTQLPASTYAGSATPAGNAKVGDSVRVERGGMAKKEPGRARTASVG